MRPARTGRKRHASRGHAVFICAESARRRARRRGAGGLFAPAGPDRGVRDLAPLPGNRLLALLGPAQEQERPYSLLLVDLAHPDAATDLGELPGRRNAKAESLTVLAQQGGQLDVLVGYDGPRNGHFESYRLQLP